MLIKIIIHKNENIIPKEVNMVKKKLFINNEDNTSKENKTNEDITKKEIQNNNKNNSSYDNKN